VYQFWNWIVGKCLLMRIVVKLRRTPTCNFSVSECVALQGRDDNQSGVSGLSPKLYALSLLGFLETPEREHAVVRYGLQVAGVLDLALWSW
jgi:hypothetical protein